jgi:hypothetical protein
MLHGTLDPHNPEEVFAKHLNKIFCRYFKLQPIFLFLKFKQLILYDCAFNTSVCSHNDSDFLVYISLMTSHV